MTKEVMKLALEALELHGKQYPHMVKGYCLDAITAIKQALAAPVQEPVIFYRCNGCGHAYEEIPPTSCDCMDGGGFNRVDYCTTPLAQPSPVQEPVLWLVDGVVQASDIPADYTGCLYTTPPAAQRQWVGLTDEEIQTAWDSVMDGAVFTRREVYKAIEAKLRSKNG